VCVYIYIGLKAWSSGCVPYMISSSVLLGHTYAAAIHRFFSTTIPVSFDTSVGLF